jgi:hypothetical protein
MMKRRNTRLPCSAARPHATTAVRHTSWSEVASLGTAIGGVLTVLTYGVVRFAYEMFYSQLGIQSADVGLSEVSMVTQSLALAVVLLVVSIAFLLCVYVGWMAGESLAEALKKWYKPLKTWVTAPFSALSRRRRLWGVAATAFLILGFMAFVSLIPSDVRANQPHLGEPEQPGVIEVLLGGVGFTVLFGFSTAVLSSLLGIRTRLSRFGPRTRRGAKALAGAVICIIAVAVTMDRWSDAWHFGEHARLGKFTASDQSTNNWLPVMTDAATVTVLGKLDPLHLCDGKSTMYPLSGSGDAILVLVVRDGRGQGVARLPSEFYAVRVGVERAQPCHV